MFSATAINKIYQKHKLKLVDAIPQITHGGSMRYIIRKNLGQKISSRLKKILLSEKKNNIDSMKGCYKFKLKVEKSKARLLKKISILKKNKQSICGYGATSKSTTILNYCKINNKHIDCIYDTTPYKIGKFSPGMHIPILDYKLFKKSNYKNIFLFAWNHKKEILRKEKHLNKIKWFTHLD